MVHIAQLYVYVTELLHFRRCKATLVHNFIHSSFFVPRSGYYVFIVTRNVTAEYWWWLFRLWDKEKVNNNFNVCSHILRGGWRVSHLEKRKTASNKLIMQVSWLPGKLKHHMVSAMHWGGCPCPLTQTTSHMQQTWVKEHMTRGDAIGIYQT